MDARAGLRECHMHSLLVRDEGLQLQGRPLQLPLHWVPGLASRLIRGPSTIASALVGIGVFDLGEG